MNNILLDALVSAHICVVFVNVMISILAANANAIVIIRRVTKLLLNLVPDADLKILPKWIVLAVELVRVASANVKRGPILKR